MKPETKQIYLFAQFGFFAYSTIFANSLITINGDQRLENEEGGGSV